MTREEFEQWFTGFWEAEGTIQVRDRYGSIVLSFAQMETYVLERIKEAVGGNVVVQSNGASVLELYKAGRVLGDTILPYVVGVYKHTELKFRLGVRDEARALRDVSAARAEFMGLVSKGGPR